MERLLILGPGRVGLSLGQALVDAEGVESVTYMGRHPDPPDHPLFGHPTIRYHYGIRGPEEGTTAVFLTVPDRVLEAMAEVLAGRGRPPPGTPALHCSGALGAEPLAALHGMGYRVGTLHPLQALADPLTGAGRLRGATFALSGEREALAAARRIVQLLGGRSLTIPTQRRPQYHAAAVMASNYLVVLLRQATRLLREVGASPEEAEQAIVALARGTLENSADLGLERALTGPVVRGDLDVIDLHLRTLDSRDRELYLLLARRTLDEAAAGLPDETVGAMRQLLERSS